MLDYETLRLIWWGLIATLLLGYAIMDGFDLGVGTLLPFIARSDAERRVLINAIGPTWDGNQVWLVLGLGAIFAAWPAIYGAAFSGMYAAMFIMLFALFLRPVGFDYRSKISAPLWRSAWDYALFLGGVIPAIVMGLAFGNLLQGVPFHFDENFRSFYTGTLSDLFNPFALLAGLLSLSMLVMHGATFLLIKTEEHLQQRASTAARIFAVLTMAVFTIAGVMLMNQVEGYRIIGEINTSAPSTPFGLHIIKETGAWLQHFSAHPWMWFAPALGIGGAATVLLLGKKRPGWSWIASSVSVAGVVATAGLAMFPFVLPSSSHPSQSLLMWNATSSQQTLWLMLIAATIFMPIIIAYTSWVFKVLRGKVTVESMGEHNHTAY